MTRTMFDSVTLGAIPADAEMAAGYVGGLYPTFAGLRARCPHAVLVSIAINASQTAQVLDVETGDATPEQAPGWVLRMRAQGNDPTVYMNASTWGAVRAAFRAVGVAEPHYWVADYDDNPTLPAGAVAKQYRTDAASDLDYSIVADHWPGVDPPGGDTDMPAPTDVIDELHGPNGSVWQLKASGEVDTITGTVFYGSYLSLPVADRQGARYFVRILGRPDGKPGYRLVANDGARYDLPV